MAHVTCNPGYYFKYILNLFVFVVRDIWYTYLDKSLLNNKKYINLFNVVA